MPYLAILVVAHPLLRRLYEAISPPAAVEQNGTVKSTPSTTNPSSRLDSRLRFDVVSSLLLVTGLHGFSALKVLLILYLNYSIAMRAPRNIMPVATWVFNIAILFANELSQGYRFSSITAAIVPFYAGAAGAGKFLDSYGGILPRWEVLFNITVLRLISFNLDYHWSLSRDRAGSPIEVSVQSNLILTRGFKRLTMSRRNNWILPIFQNAIESQSLPQRQLTHPLVLILHTPCIHHYTLLVPY